MSTLHLAMGRRGFLCAAAILLLGQSPLKAATPCCQRCPKCSNKVCVPVPETVKENKFCWDIGCKEICIPKFKWWWEDCCTPPRCGKVKVVKVLKKVDYECESCGHRWEIQSTGCDCASCTAASKSP